MIARESERGHGSDAGSEELAVGLAVLPRWGHSWASPRGLQDIYDVWVSDPLFYPATPPAHWLMSAEVEARVLVVPLAPARDLNPRRCRPIGCYEAAPGLASQYRRDR